MGRAAAQGALRHLERRPDRRGRVRRGDRGDHGDPAGARPARGEPAPVRQPRHRDAAAAEERQGRHRLPRLPGRRAVQLPAVLDRRAARPVGCHRAHLRAAGRPAARSRSGPGRAAPGPGDRRSVTQPTPSAAGAGLLADLAALGPYFAVEVHRPGSPLRPPWQSLGELTGSPGALAGRIGEVRERLAAAAGCPAAAVEFRVAASIAQLGLCARLLSPALGAAATGRTLPVDVGQARWVPALGGPFRLSLPEAAVPEAAVATEAGTAATAVLLAGPITQIVRAVEAMAVSPRVLWGNVASAVNGAATMIAAVRPDLSGQAAEAAAALLRHPDLAGTYQGRPLKGFRRRNCCLIYRLSPEQPAYCGDCVLGR